MKSSCENCGVSDTSFRNCCLPRFSNLCWSATLVRVAARAAAASAAAASVAVITVMTVDKSSRVRGASRAHQDRQRVTTFPSQNPGNPQQDIPEPSHSTYQQPTDKTAGDISTAVKSAIVYKRQMEKHACIIDPRKASALGYWCVAPISCLHTLFACCPCSQRLRRYAPVAGISSLPLHSCTSPSSRRSR